MGPRLNKVCVGGTFDMMHKGHRALLSRAFEEGKHVVIGVSSDSFVRATGKRHDVQSYEDRVDALRSYLENSRLLRTTIVPLDDRYGPSVTDPQMEGIVVSTETVGQTVMINRLRVARQLAPLEVIVVDLVAADDGRRISSTRIRRGQIDSEGRVTEARRVQRKD